MSCCKKETMVVELEDTSKPACSTRQAVTENMSIANESFEADYTAFQKSLSDDLYEMKLITPDIHCAGCISKIEKALLAHKAVSSARVNLTTKHVTIHWYKNKAEAGELIDLVSTLGFHPVPVDFQQDQTNIAEQNFKKLLIAMAVAGFAAANVMLLSVSVWSGADGATRDMFHWLSALIALPAIAYAGQPFYRSAWAALKGGHLNMDVPISLAVILAAAMSLYQTTQSGEHAYFDAALSLLFFLLIGRTLDHLMRAKAFSAAHELLALQAKGATVITSEGQQRYIPLRQIKKGMTVLVAAGEQIPVDGKILTGESEIDPALLTGETIPEFKTKGDQVHAGMLNLSNPLQIQVTAVGEETLLAEIVELMSRAENQKARYRKIADKAASIYAPAVHIISALAFLGWWAWGGDWQQALFIAITVLIITCPCALGLAVPAVQVVASGRAMKNGIMMKDGVALEKLSEIDTIVFDKTGTLTRGKPVMLTKDRSGQPVSNDSLAMAASLAMNSRHPLSKAIVHEARKRNLDYGNDNKLTDVSETAGQGLSAQWQGKLLKIGSRQWCGVEADGIKPSQNDKSADLLELWVSVEGEKPLGLIFDDQLREDANAIIKQIKQLGFDVLLLSGDRDTAVQRKATEVGIDQAYGGLTPIQKTQLLDKGAGSGKCILMVGDGLNDAPALASAHVSMSPSAASDIAQTAANFVFMGEKLSPVLTAIHLSHAAKKLIFQNFALALIYNLIAVPIAVMGFATPIVAAIAMSTSSIIVTLNALRLRWMRFPGHQLTDGRDQFITLQTTSFKENQNSDHLTQKAMKGAREGAKA